MWSPTYPPVAVVPTRTRLTHSGYSHLSNHAERPHSSRSDAARAGLAAARRHRVCNRLPCENSPRVPTTRQGELPTPVPGPDPFRKVMDTLAPTHAAEPSCGTHQ